VTVGTELPRSGAPAQLPARPPAPRWRAYAAGLVAAWLLPLITHVLHADLVLLLVIWLGTASLLRSGRTLVDRLVLAAPLLLGALVSGGILFSLWPLRLHPVPVAGVALSALVVIAWLSGRRPRLPLRADLSDGVLIAGTIVAAVVITRPMRGGVDDRLAVLVRGEDAARHFAIFDNVQRLDGYLYFHRDEVAPALQKGFESYPQGAHMIMAVVDNFLHSAASYGTTLTHFDDFARMYAVWFALSTACLLWAARWVAGGRLRGWGFLPIAAGVAGYFVFGDGIPIFINGFVSEVAAIGPMALLIALTVRPVRDAREQIVLVAALVGVLSMIYYLFLLSAAVVVAAWAVMYRRNLLRHRLWTVAAVVVGAAVTLFAPVANLSQANSVSQLTRAGGIEPLNRRLLVILILLVAGALVASRVGRRAPAYRMLAVWLAVSWAYALGLLLKSGTYYYEKALHQLMIAGLVGAGALVLLVRPGAWPRRSARLARITSSVVTGTAVGLAMVFFSGPYWVSFGQPDGDLSWGEGYFRYDLRFINPARTTVDVYQRQPTPDGMVSVILVEGDAFEMTNYAGTLWLSVLHRDNGLGWQEAMWVLGPKTEADVYALARDNPEPVRFFTNSPMVVAAVNRLAAEDPARRVQVVQIVHPVPG
jgi:hypothetical protein